MYSTKKLATITVRDLLHMLNEKQTAKTHPVEVQNILDCLQVKLSIEHVFKCKKKKKIIIAACVSMCVSV